MVENKNIKSILADLKGMPIEKATSFEPLEIKGPLKSEMLMIENDPEIESLKKRIAAVEAQIQKLLEEKKINFNFKPKSET